jgi:SWI/SNF-related matrix-associated actin-dependent regulator 1 of chromatin subfamily A
MTMTMVTKRNKLPETSGAGDALEAAVRTLAARCDGAAAEDGAGFNRLDARLGRKLAETPVAQWTPRQRRAAWAMLKKYRGQLAGLGIDYDAIPEPPVPEAKERAENWAGAAKSGGFVVGFGYDPLLVAEVKRIPGRRFDREDKTWDVPASMEAIEPLLRFIAEHGFDFSAALVERAETVAGEHAERVEASRAEDAEIEVEGLGGELRPFQRAGVAYALRARRTYIADEQGLGKTVQALATVHAAGAYPALIVCPASLKLNWKREAERWLPGRRVEVLEGKSAGYEGADIVVVNYDVLGKHAETLKALGIEAIVLDESQYAKNRKAKRTRLCKDLAQGVSVRLLLSGTPLLSRPEEIISQLDIMGRLDDLGGFWHFARRYCDMDRGRFGLDLSGASNLTELNEKLRAKCYVRRLKSEVLKELPAKQRSTLPVSISNRREYRRAEADVARFVGEAAANDERRVAEAVERWRQERDGREPSQGEMRAIRSEVRTSARANAERAEQLVRINALKQLAAQGKMDAVTEWVETFLESGEKLVLFAHHREIVRALAERFGAPSITGDTPAEARQAAVDAFQNDPEVRLIVLNLQAGGVGLTLTAASNVAFCELGWTPAAHDQAEDRCHRIGQTDSVTAYYLLAEQTIDEDIEELIERKRRVVSEATEGGEAARADEGILGELKARLAARVGGGKSTSKKKGA